MTGVSLHPRSPLQLQQSRQQLQSPAKGNDNLNLKGAYFEVLSDLLTSIGVIIAALDDAPFPVPHDGFVI